MVDGSRIQEIEGEIAIGGYVHAVGRERLEAQVARHGFAIERKAAAGQRARPERHHVHAAAGFGEALRIAREHLEIGQQVMRP